jgi:hypothetical protein
MWIGVGCVSLLIYPPALLQYSFVKFPVAKFRNGAACLVIVSRDSMICLEGLSEKVTLSSVVWCCVAFATGRRFTGGMSPKPMYEPLVTLFCPFEPCR